MHFLLKLFYITSHFGRNVWCCQVSWNPPYECSFINLSYGFIHIFVFKSNIISLFIRNHLVFYCCTGHSLNTILPQIYPDILWKHIHVQMILLQKLIRCAIWGQLDLFWLNRSLFMRSCKINVFICTDVFIQSDEVESSPSTELWERRWEHVMHFHYIYTNLFVRSSYSTRL